MKPSKQTVERVASILREAHELALVGEPILLSEGDVLALVATSVPEVHASLKRGKRPSRSRR